MCVCVDVDTQVKEKRLIQDKILRSYYMVTAQIWVVMTVVTTVVVVEFLQPSTNITGHRSNLHCKANPIDVFRQKHQMRAEQATRCTNETPPLSSVKLILRGGALTFSRKT